MTFTRRRLPHWHPPGAALFVTWRLEGSLPPNRVFPPHSMTSGRAFVAMDRILDAGRVGPLYLKHPEIAEMVVEAIRHGESELGHYDLHAFVVMPNHVHLLLTPKVRVPDLLRSLKGITAKRANQLLGASGNRFWQGESYDHWVRDDREFDRIKGYIENNPVNAGLAPEAEAFPWSSGAGQGAGCGPGGPPYYHG